MEDRWKRRQEQSRDLSGPSLPPPVPDNSRFTEEQKLEAWREMHAVHLQRQTNAIESIRTYVAIWFWLTIVGAVLAFIAISTASRSIY